MANYKDIHGTNIETVSSDPSNPINGQVWYNSTDQVLKGFTSTPAGTWATSNALNVARSSLSAQNIGIQTAALCVGGYGEPPPNNAYAGVESYNGSSWTEGADLNNGRSQNAGCGTQTAAITAGGDPFPSVQTKTETWNGSSWTEVNALNTGNKNQAMAGGSPAATQFGGGPPVRDNTESWNGTSWTEVADQNTGRQQVSGFGTATACLAVGGTTNPSDDTFTADVETWNGTAWTEGANLNTARTGMSSQGAVYTAGFAAGGETKPNTANALTESWNGTAWTEDGDLNVARSNFGGGGTITAGLVCGGGKHPGLANETEEWTSPTTSTVTFANS